MDIVFMWQNSERILFKMKVGLCLFPPPHFLASDMSILVTTELLQLNQMSQKSSHKCIQTPKMLCLTFAMGALKL